MVIEIKRYQLIKYLDKTKLYLKDAINNRKKHDKRQIQLAIAFNFISSNDNNEGHAMHSKSDNLVESWLLTKQVKL